MNSMSNTDNSLDQHILNDDTDKNLDLIHIKNKKRLSFISSFLHKMIIGIISGLTAIIPGVSAANILRVTNTWELTIISISNIFNFKDFNLLNLSWKFLIPIAIGGLIGYFSFAFLFDFLVNWKNESEIFFYIFFSTIIFCSIFIGLRKVALYKAYNTNKEKSRKNITIFLLSAFIVASISITSFSITNFVTYEPWYENLSNWAEIVLAFALGFISVSTMILPGISGSMILLIIGVYDFTIDNIVSFNWNFIVSFAIGGIIGILLVAFFLKKIINKKSLEIEISVNGALISSLFACLLFAPWSVATLNSIWIIPLGLFIGVLFFKFLIWFSKE